MKIRNKINLVFLFIFLSVEVAAGSVLFYRTQNALKNQAVVQIQNISSSKAQNVRTFLESEKEVVGILAASTVFRNFLETQTDSEPYLAQKDITEQRLDRSIVEVNQIFELFLIDKEGKIVASTDRKNEGQDKSQDLYFTQAKEKIFIKDLYYSETIKKMNYTVSAPISNELTGEFLGTIVARMNPDNLNNILASNIAMGETGENFLINGEKYLITPSRYFGLDAILKTKVETQNSQECFSSEDQKRSLNDYSVNHFAISFIDYRGMQIIGTHAYIPEANWCLITKMDQTEIFAPVRQMVYVFILIFIFSVLIFFSISYWLSAKISKPLAILQKEADIIGEGDLNFEMQIESQDEIGQLSQSFQKMTHSLREARGEMEQKIFAQTKEINKQKEDLEIRQKAILNILEDVEWEKKNVSMERDKIDAILHSIGDGVFVVDEEKRITMINKVTEKISGFSGSELRGEIYNQKLKFVFEKDNQENSEFIDQAIKTGKIQEMANHTMLVRKDGTQVAVADSAAPLKNKKGEVIGCVVVFRDVTKEREVDRMKTEFVSLASHQLRTPLTSIKWYAELLLTDEAKNKLEGEKKDFVQEIHNGNERMINLVNDLLNVSRIETGNKFVIEKKDTDIVEIITQAIQEQEVLAKQKNIQIVCENKPQGTVIISADGEKIKQVFQNFISNAVKYSSEGSVITIGCSEDKDTHIFSVKDQGVGIPKDQQDRIFEKFFRASNVLLTEAEGTGLGLYIAKSIIEGHGGKIWFESEEKKGTTFYISLPKKS